MRPRMVYSATHGSVRRARNYRVGDYVTWSWDMTTALGAGWVAMTNSEKRISAWSGSALFAGAASTASRSPSLDSIRMFPEDEATLSPGDWGLTQVVGLYSDGIGAWEAPVVPESLSVDDSTIAFVDSHSVLHGKSFGRGVLSSRFEGMFRQTTLNIVAGTAGDRRYFLGGLPRVSAAAIGRDGIFITDQSESVYFATRSEGLEVFTKIAAATPSVAGMDSIACSATGDLYIRHVGRRSVLHFAPTERTKYADIRLPNDRSPVGITAVDNVLYIADSRGTVWTYRSGHLEELCSVTTEEDGGYTLTHVIVVGDTLFVFDNRNALFKISRETGSFDVLSIPGPPNRVSACASVDDDLLVTDFHEGTLSKVVGSSLNVIARDFVNPTGIAVESTNSVLVCNFGAGNIDRVFL